MALFLYEKSNFQKAPCFHLRRRLKMKKCPTCNSTRYEFVEGAFRCARCGYVNYSDKKLEERFEKNGISKSR